MHELQSYFIKRVEKILESQNKKPIGWDEILEGGLAPNATVMSWRGMKGGIEGAKAGHHVIMTPTNHCYLDLYQGNLPLNPILIQCCHTPISPDKPSPSPRSSERANPPG